MFGGIAAAGPDRFLYATFDGQAVTLDAESGEVTGHFTVFPCGPLSVHLSAVAVGDDGAIYLGDSQHGRVRRFDATGLQTGLLGAPPTPGIEEPDEAGVVAEPCGILARPGEVFVATGGFGARHGVQAFAGGEYRRSLVPPAGHWRRAQGLAWIGGALWATETEGGALWRFSPEPEEVDLHPDLRRPFRVANDGFDGALLLLQPDEDETFGVARLDRAGRFEGWAVKAGEGAGKVFLPFDFAVLADGRFLVADLPLGEPPEVRLQLFAADGTPERVLLEGNDALRAALEQRFRAILDRKDGSAETLYLQARVNHFHSGGSRFDEAARLYAAAAAAEPGFVLAHLGLATVLHHGLDQPAAAEPAYRRAADAGGDPGEMQARIAECRRACGDFDGAIAILQQVVESETPPEDPHARLEELGSWYLERAGESAET